MGYTRHVNKDDNATSMKSICGIRTSKHSDELTLYLGLFAYMAEWLATL
jgi:hypothetical protein